MSNIKAIVLRDNKSIKEILVPDSLCTGQLDISVVTGIKSKGHDNIERECDYEWNDNLISMYCWSEGSESKINKHDLPPPVDNELYYGDILVLRHNNGNLLDLSKDNYNQFYEDAFGGFEDIEEEEEVSSDEEPTQSDLDFIASEGELSDEDYTDGAEDESEEAVSDSEEESEEDSADLDLHDESSSNPTSSIETPDTSQHIEEIQETNTDKKSNNE
tara:strand:+ start:4581 stop:5231 length:651 start_codon:yes stop_codon:yes gene_type:complete